MSELTDACPDCDGAGELVRISKGDQTDAVKGVTAVDRIRKDGWEYEGTKECLNCVGYGHVDARTGEI